MTDPVERFSAAALEVPFAGARVMRPELRRVDVHWHDYYELSLVVDGRAEHVVNGRVGTLGPGDAFLLSPADFHSITSVGDEPLTCYNTVIAAELMERQLDGLGAPGPDDLPWHASGFDDTASDFERLRRELEEPRLGSARLTEAIVACLVVELARRSGVAEPDGAPPLADADLRAAVLHVDRHFREPLTLAGVAAVAHLSPNYFSERFRELTGTPFQSYLQERRLRFARSLLAATTLSVTEVCHAAGFNSLSHFGRAYRRQYGAAPSARVR
ncbi:AraC family transcriptional regulator [Nocardioides sp. SYSU D00038]|uniref:helix-turn-helix transcriptional regulator n=1 Tax=Nocardioides sp. SYSU D00038 TaxID=2812554 RepID=UPI00196766F8|nr:AraC family transcriptional regulator [Nocardioides sp. SYSU D00038]